MPREIEAKFKVDGFAAVKRSLEKTGAVLVAKAIQTDRYFDDSRGKLLKADIAIRLRTSRPNKSATAALLTYKGPAKRTGQAKSRTEIQTALDNEKAILAILESTGLSPTFVIQKKRISYRLGRSMIELDELPAIGKFVEIESPSEREIVRIQKLLALSGPAITDHYIRLAQKGCKQLKGRCKCLTFDPCKRCRTGEK